MRRHMLRFAVLGAAAFAASGCAGGAPAAAPAKALPPPQQLSKAEQPGFTENLDGQIRRAQELRAHGHYKKAVLALAQLMLLAPDDPRVVGEYGKSLVQLGRSKEALAFLDRAIELKPKNWSLLSARGVAQDQLGDTKAAIQSYRAALALSPHQPSILNNYGLNQMMSGHKAQAKALFQEALDHGGTDPRIAQNLAQLSASASARAVAENGAAAAGPAQTPRARLRPHAERLAKASLLTTKMRFGAPVVIEKVPSDPLAGKHYGRPHKPALKDSEKAAPPHLASAAPAPKTPGSIPALRTADDVY